MKKNTDAPNTVTAEVIKSELPALLTAPAQTGLEGELYWPIEPLSLLTLYRASPEHARAVHLKAEGSCGLGLSGDAATQIEQLCPKGSADLFVDLMLDQECYGNAFLQVIRTQGGKVVELRRLPAISMARFRSGYRQRLFNADGKEKITTFTQAEIIHLRPPCPGGGYYALPIWIGAEGMLELAHAAARYNAQFFKNNAMPEYAVITKGSQLTAAQKASVKAFFRREYQGLDNSHRTLYLHLSDSDAEIDFKKVTADTKDGDFLKLMDSARERVIAAHGVPPRLMSIAQSGQLGGGGELQGQLFMFEALALKPRRRRLLDQCQPLLADLGIARNDLHFVPMDMTPPGDDTRYLADYVREGILSSEEARTLLPAFQDGADAPRKADTAALSKSEGQSSTDELIAILERL